MKNESVQLFMSKSVSCGKSYIKRTLLPLICIIVSLILLAFTLAFAAAVKALILLPLMFMAVSVVLLLRAVKNVNRDALVFCLINGSALYAVDARPVISSGSRTSLGLIGNGFKLLFSTAKALDKLASEGIPEEDILSGGIGGNASRITQINKLRHIPGGRFAHCEIITSRGRSSTQQYDISNHSQALFELLESRCLSGEWETAANTYTKQICLSALALLLCVSLCAAAHPSAALLPTGLYFPCLFALCIPAIFLGIFVLKRKRGE